MRNQANLGFEEKLPDILVEHRKLKKPFMAILSLSQVGTAVLEWTKTRRELFYDLLWLKTPFIKRFTSSKELMVRIAEYLTPVRTSLA